MPLISSVSQPSMWHGMSPLPLEMKANQAFPFSVYSQRSPECKPTHHTILIQFKYETIKVLHKRFQSPSWCFLYILARILLTPVYVIIRNLQNVPYIGDALCLPVIMVICLLEVKGQNHTILHFIVMQDNTDKSCLFLWYQDIKSILIYIVNTQLVINYNHWIMFILNIWFL